MRKYVWMAVVLVSAVLLSTGVENSVLACNPSPKDHPAIVQDGPGSTDLEALAEAVRSENEITENFTIWAGGELSPPSVSMYMPDGVEIGHKLTAFAFPMFRGGVSILDRIDGPVLINFWASWCGPCIDEFPTLAELALDDTMPFTVLFVNVWDAETQARAFIEGRPSDLLIVFDEGDDASTDYGLVAIPTSFLVDEDGILQIVHVGNMTDVVSRFFIGVAGAAR